MITEDFSQEEKRANLVNNLSNAQLKDILLHLISTNTLTIKKAQPKSSEETIIIENEMYVWSIEREDTQKSNTNFFGEDEEDDREGIPSYPPPYITL